MASGELRFRPQSFSYCGHCDQYFMSCTCHGIPHAHDFNFKCLPRPPDGSTPQMLLRRWCSCVAQSSSMGRFEALKWYRDHSSAKLRAMANKRAAWNDMVEEYVARLPSDPHLPLLAKAIGIRGAPAEGAPRLAREARSAPASFVAGAWAPVPRGGAVRRRQQGKPPDVGSDVQKDRRRRRGVFVVVGRALLLVRRPGARPPVARRRLPAALR